jgi:hypothetical protein
MSKVFHKFQAFDKNTNKNVNYVIQIFPNDRINDAVEFMVKYFITEEAMCECKKVAEDPESVEFCKRFSKEVFSEMSSLVCFEEGCSDIVAVNLLTAISEAESQGVMEVLFSHDIIKLLFKDVLIF